MNGKFNEQKDILISIKKEISLLHQQVDYLIRNEKPLGLLDLDVMMNRTHTIYDLMCGVEVGSEEEVLPNETDTIRAMFGIEDNDEETKEEPIEEEPIVEEPVVEDTPIEKKDDFGFILNFEPAEETQPSVFTSGDEIEMNIPQVETQNEKTEPNAKEEEIPYEPVIFGNMTEKEDAGFELDTPETLGDKLQQEEDHSLAAKLQHSTVKDLRKAIGINEKFLFVNELFGGSMEKYNKSIENLNDLKTLNGALIYMNELRIELQWNSNNEAYKKLLELVHRKYEA